MDIREEHLVVSRTARYAVLGLPSTDLREVWFVCHGYLQLARRFLRAFQPVAGPERLLVAPEGLSRGYHDHRGPHGPDARIGATWMTREDRETEISDYVGWLDALYDHVMAGIAPRDVRVRALGFSQGTHTASRWVAMGVAKVDELILWSGGFPPDYPWDDALPRLSGMEVTLVAGTEDALATRARAEAEVEDLRHKGLSARVLVFEGGHRIEEAPLREVARL